MRNSKNVQHYLFGRGSFGQLEGLISPRRNVQTPNVVFILDHYFRKAPLELPLGARDHVEFVDTTHEPTTAQVDELTDKFKKLVAAPAAIVGIGGGSTLDIAKAVSNLYSNEGKAENYQGWDLVKNPGVYKIGIPTLSGTGAEASRTCVMMNYQKNLKLGMNSEFTVFDQLILDPDLTESVPRNQYFFSGMDTYIHCVESLAGSYRNAVGDAFSHQALQLCRDVYLSPDMLSVENREKVMVASYLGGCAIANSYVGVVHPFSAGLSMVFGTHHCLANCIVMTAMDEYYPEATQEFRQMLQKQRIELPKVAKSPLTADQKKQLFDATVIHEKPLINALGNDYRKILTPEKVTAIFERMLNL